ncbi:MAG: hypothetical protein PW734_09885 [Verrucomicrobium sp.]|nr:hypothetical protein [Verrucomicrobium sp.]
MPSLIISLAAGIGLLFGLLGGTFVAAGKVKLPPRPAPHAVKPVSMATSSAKSFDDFTKIAAELDSWRRELTERNNKALLLDAELAKREQLLQAERGALDQERSRLEHVQKDMEDRLIKIKQNETPRLQELADLYSTMKPDDAVSLLRVLPPEQATKVVTVMKQKTAAKLLSNWIEKYPGDKALVAQITNDLVRTIDQPSSSTDLSSNNPSSSSPANP